LPQVPQMNSLMIRIKPRRVKRVPILASYDRGHAVF
jgi:hypothetical protein